LICTEVITKIRSTRLEPKLPTRSSMFSCNSPPPPFFSLLFFCLFTSAGLLATLRRMEDAIQRMKSDLLFFAFLPDYNHVISIIEFWLLRAQWRRQKDLLLRCHAISGVNKPVKISVFWDMTPCSLVDT
jgi:hypothetical protein